MAIFSTALQQSRTVVRTIRRHAFSAVMVLMIGYLSAKLLAGDQGILRYRELQAEKQEAMQTLTLVMEDRMSLEYRVQRMRPDSLDLDLLEEEAKSMLGLARPDERVIMLEEE